MKGYLSVVDSDSGAIRVDSRMEIFRALDGHQKVLIRADGNETDLGVRDATVSRLKNDRPPIVLEPRQSCIEVHNRRNTNGVTVVCNDDRTELDEGQMIMVDDSSKIGVGYQTEFWLRVEQEATTRIEVDGDIGGDVVAGDQTKVNESTRVEDSVVNRSDVGGDKGATVDDSVVNRSSVGSVESGTTASDDSTVRGGNPDDEDTKNRCEVHDTLYSGDVCPECEAKREAPGIGGAETMFCTFCGADVPAAPESCSECGEQLPDS